MSPKSTNPNLDSDPDFELSDDNGQANANDNGQANTPANDNGGAITPAPKASALASTSLAALAATFKNVDTTPIRGRPIHPLLQFKSREGGVWMFGQRRTIPEADSTWAVNPISFLWGWVCWGDASKTLGERLVPVDKELPDVAELPDTGFPWQQQMAVSLKCISGSDAGVEVVFKTNTEGGKGEVVRLIEAVRDRLGGQHERPSRADRATRSFQLRTCAVRQDLRAGAEHRGLDGLRRSGTGT